MTWQDLLLRLDNLRTRIRTHKRDVNSLHGPSPSYTGEVKLDDPLILECFTSIMENLSLRDQCKVFQNLGKEK